MLDQTVVVYCICDEIVKSLGIQDDAQCRMSSAEVMTFAVYSATVFGCDYRRSHLFARHHRYFTTPDCDPLTSLGAPSITHLSHYPPRSTLKSLASACNAKSVSSTKLQKTNWVTIRGTNLLSVSQLVRRIHQIPEHVWMMIFLALQVFVRDKSKKLFIVDSFPVKAYENHKSFRARIFSGNKYHGYSASRKQFFFGIKVHMVVDSEGVPVEFSFSPGSSSDIKGLRNLPLNLPEKSILFGDAAYTDYKFEDALSGIEDIRLVAKRKKNLKRQHSPADAFALRVHRNRIETTFSSITSRMPRYIKARTEKGFCLKVMFFILAHMVHLYFPMT